MNSYLQRQPMLVWTLGSTRTMLLFYRCGKDTEVQKGKQFALQMWPSSAFLSSVSETSIDLIFSHKPRSPLSFPHVFFQVFLKSSFLLPLSSPTCPFPHYSPQYLDYCSRHSLCLLAIIVLSILHTPYSIMGLPWSLDKDAQENTNFYFIPTQQVYQLRETWRYH